MVTVDSNTGRLIPTKGGPPAAATVNPPKVEFKTREISATGSVDLRGSPGDNCAGFTLGFMQLQFVEVNRARYRGPTNNDGSVDVNRDRPPARPGQLCRDTLDPTSLFYAPPAFSAGAVPTVLPAGTTIPAGGRLQMAATFWDSPSEDYPISENNTLFAPPRVNRLYSVTIGFAFCTILTVQEPGGRFHFIKHFYWNCRWNLHFSPIGLIVRLDPVQQMDLNLQAKVHSGVPNDARFNRTHLLSSALPVCNAVAIAAAAGNIVRHRTWT